MHPKKRQRVSPESRHDGEKDKRPVTSLFGSTMMVGGLSRAFRLFKVPILIYAALRRECHLSRFEGKAQCESEVAVGPPLLSNVLKLRFADRNDLLVCLTPPSEPPFQRVQIARELVTSVTTRLTSSTSHVPPSQIRMPPRNPEPPGPPTFPLLQYEAIARREKSHLYNHLSHIFRHQ